MPVDSPKDWRDHIETSFGRGIREQRSEQRSRCNIPAQVWVEGEARDGTAAVRRVVVRNLSNVGAFLETDPMPVGTRLRLKLDTEQGERCAEVAWFEDPGPSARVRTLRGVGVRFLAAEGAA